MPGNLAAVFKECVVLHPTAMQELDDVQDTDVRELLPPFGLRVVMLVQLLPFHDSAMLT
jgi:hypothetical protein